MINQGLHHLRNKTIPSHIGLGYQLNKTGDAANIAFNLATELVRDAVKEGERLRLWAIETRGKAHELLKLRNIKEENSVEIQSAITKVVFWENQISASIRDYFINITNLLNRLKILNPPLKSEQLEPYLEAILADRRSTMADLEPLRKVIDRIGELKTKCWFENSLKTQP